MGSHDNRRVHWLRQGGAFFIGAAFLTAGVVLLILLSREGANADVPELAAPETALPVECIVAQSKDVPVTIEAFGETRSLRRVMVAPEVSGTLLWTHDALLVGGVIPQGDTILSIDPEQYVHAVNQAAAHVNERVTRIERLVTEWENDRERLQSLLRRRDLARQQFERLKALMDDEVGTQEAIDFAEQAYVVAQDETDQLADRIALYPIHIDEARNALAMAQAELDTARLRLSKTEIHAPFDARVSAYSVETGQFVQAGQHAAELVDDSIIEIAVPLDSREARKWLQFSSKDDSADTAWFSSLERVECAVVWTEAANESVSWSGHLDRVAESEDDSRTVTVVVRVDGTEGAKRRAGLPLVEGMYCRVEIPGTTMHNVFAVPASSVTVDDTVYCVEDNRLHSRAVEIVRRAEGVIYIQDGLSEGDVVVTTRLINPLERTLVAPTIHNTADAA